MEKLNEMEDEGEWEVGDNGGETDEAGEAK